MARKNRNIWSIESKRSNMRIGAMHNKPKKGAKKSPQLWHLNYKNHSDYIVSRNDMEFHEETVRI